ncbi:uncharacterized protein LOC123542710 [Mercenaria mercenaria]|uniref:uncharacterized protein LOC123542710 n=1 Tax=Mercenaria mercenaria TaxID=6596 RepID=UPI00234EC632|nr:uncharacterized protein LOC123542710 [Mercenaria mercenaria]
MTGYDKVIVMTLILIFGLNGILTTCRKRCRENNPKPCEDGYVCKEDNAKVPVKRCFESVKDFQCSDGSRAKECDCNAECSNSLDEASCNCTEYSEEFVKIPGYFISGYTVGSRITVSTDQQCNEHCLTNAECKSFEIATTYQYCYLNSIAPAEMNETNLNRFKESDIYNLFVKKCKNCVK